MKKKKNGKKVGAMLRDMLQGLISPEKREDLAQGLERIEDQVDRLGDLLRGYDDDDTDTGDVVPDLAAMEASIAELTAQLDQSDALIAALSRRVDALETGSGHQPADPGAEAALA